MSNDFGIADQSIVESTIVPTTERYQQAIAPRFGYVWRAHYEDQTFVDEHDAEHPEGRGFGTLDLPRVQAIELVPLRAHLRPYVVKIDRAAGMRPIFFRRHSVILDPISETELGRGCVHCLGFQKTVEVGGEKRNVATYTFIFEDGSCLVTDDHNAV